ncbi:AAEL015118-PA, partial [Aedes aegypti]
LCNVKNISFHLATRWRVHCTICLLISVSRRIVGNFSKILSKNMEPPFMSLCLGR